MPPRQTDVGQVRPATAGHSPQGCIDRVHGLQVCGEMGNTFVTWYECPKFVKKEGYHAVEGGFGSVAETRVGYVCIR